MGCVDLGQWWSLKDLNTSLNFFLANVEKAKKRRHRYKRVFFLNTLRLLGRHLNILLTKVLSKKRWTIWTFWLFLRLRLNYTSMYFESTWLIALNWPFKCVFTLTLLTAFWHMHFQFWYEYSQRKWNTLPFLLCS